MKEKDVRRKIKTHIPLVPKRAGSIYGNSD